MREVERVYSHVISIAGRRHLFALQIRAIGSLSHLIGDRSFHLGKMHSCQTPTGRERYELISVYSVRCQPAEGATSQKLSRASCAEFRRPQGRRSY